MFTPRYKRSTRHRSMPCFPISNAFSLQTSAKIPISFIVECYYCTCTLLGTSWNEINPKVGPHWVDWKLILNSLQCFLYTKQKFLPRFVSLHETKLQAMQLYEDTRKLFNEFEIRLRSTRFGSALVNTNHQQYIHSAKYKFHTSC